MTQGSHPEQISLLQLDAAPAPVPVWRVYRFPHSKLATIREHTPSGWTVHHCGHPTANYPYFIVTAEGERIVAPNGRGSRRLALALSHVEQHAPRKP